MSEHVDSAETLVGARPRDAVTIDPPSPWSVDEVEVVATNFKQRLSGVTSTIERVVPVQARSVRIATLGPGLAEDLPRIRFRDLAGLWGRPPQRPFRIWHARRNIEMLPGILLRDLLRMPLRLVFTSAAQRRHTRWTRSLIRRMDAVIATSRASASYLERPSTVIGHGIDTAGFHPVPYAAALADLRRSLGLPSDRLVGCFGRVREQKGTDLFVDAMIKLLPSRPGTSAVVLGRATESHRSFLSELERRVSNAGLNDRILFLGEVPRPIAPWYRALDLFVAPQRWEGFGVTPLEAMASGVPVVATRVGAFEELLVVRDEDPSAAETGILIPPGDTDAMVAAVAAFLDAPPRLEAAGRAARDHVQRHFSIESEASAINEVYESLWSAASR